MFFESSVGEPAACNNRMDAVREALVGAIRAGAPQYNAGAIDACAALYKSTARRMVETGVAPKLVAEALSSAASEADQQASASDAAWTMRRCFDAILDGRLDAAAAVPEGAKEVVLLDFESGLPPGGPRWSSMDDGVMGGLSTSSLSWDPVAQAAVFQGNLTTANNGGFASVRSEAWGGYAAMTGAAGIRLVVQGDGRTYKLSAKSDDGYDGVMYQRDFATRSDGSWDTLDLPFSSFRPNFRGRVVPDRPPITGAQVRQLGLMVSKVSDGGGVTQGFRTGAFRLGLRSIRAYF
ncbi:hypothetical protein FOA52_008103 [Chlamydomonas sp. UWO 241]|nr:hypothetical protein FOA52_008103 [Chlamydomonas sp. UWO 241]